MRMVFCAALSVGTLLALSSITQALPDTGRLQEVSGPSTGQAPRANTTVPAAIKVAQNQGRSVEPPITGPNCPRTGAKSPRSNARAKVTFLNSSQPGAISLYWVDFSGNSVHYANIARGKTYVVDSFVGHVWVLLNAQGRCIATTAVPAGAPTLAY